MRWFRCLFLLLLAGWFCTIQPTNGFGQEPGIVVVKPKPFDGTLVNPDIGFTTFQRFNGDSLNTGTKWTEGFPIQYQPFHGSLQTKDFPMTTIAYFRIYWRFVEPQQGVYNWAMLDKALQTAHARHQTLMLRIAPYGTGPESDVPDWYRKVTGEVLRKAPFNVGHSSWYRPLPSSHPDWSLYESQWMVDPMNPAYTHFFGDMIRALGARYDGDPDLDLVDISIVGPWGEGAGTPMLTTQVMHSLMDSYLDSFHKTPLVVQPTDPKTDGYAMSKAYGSKQGNAALTPQQRANLGEKRPRVGWRADCLGDLGIFSKTWNHMTDYYPEAVIEDGLQNAWKTAPVSLEACGVMQTWKDHGWDISYIIDQSLKWHVSSFNAKSSAVPKEWWPEVNRWLKHMGYRFALRRFTYPAVIGPDRKIAFTSWWENDGDAPCYRKFTLALRLSNNQTSAVIMTSADIRTWMPGDNLYNNSVFIPANLPDGDYQVSIAILDSLTRKPAIKLAIQGMEADGWYDLGKVTVHQTLAANTTEANPAPSHP